LCDSILGHFWKTTQYTSIVQLKNKLILISCHQQHQWFNPDSRFWTTQDPRSLNLLIPNITSYSILTDDAKSAQALVHFNFHSLFQTSVLDPDPYWISAGFRRATMTHKNRKKKNSHLEVHDVLFYKLKASQVA
jgi:hypothetical protein